MFVGATDIVEDGTFKWYNGETVDLHLLPLAPSEDYVGGENCLVMDSGQEYRFGDRGCSEKLDLLCQIQLGY